MTRIRRRHHVLRVKHLLCELRDRQGTVARRSSSGERRKADHKEVKTRERNHIHGEFPEVGVQLPWESKASGDSGHHHRYQGIQIAVRGCVEFQRSGANVVKRFVIDTESLVGVLNQLVD